ncbi:UbiA prenyltransferase family protein [Tieghemostelium lacteum]|uniref:UbiA prenyltransferase family protein n=1 Tax=Tieghemostelium lacteum TaxID=361077 RepID=A0A152A9Z9_TIELA|nr:UbiA prenyltransferase family protein [Tieghemostelium lacteum]|eukprot:KYR03048.1 UbiA prenyltransferase family protein [Tieghemostelium lacteum]
MKQQQQQQGQTKRKVDSKVTLKSMVMGTRPWSLTAAFSSVLVGSALAFRETHTFDLVTFIIVTVGAISTQCFANLINSYYDFKFGVDKKETSDDRTMFDYGLSERLVTRMIYFFISVCLMSLIALCYKINHIPVITESLLPLVLVGALLSIFYTAAPVSLKYIGLGDVAITTCFGPLLVQAAFLAQTNFTHTIAYYYSLPIGLTIEAILHVNNTRDIKFDKLNGGFTLATILGETGCYYVYILLYLIAYAFNYLLSIQPNGKMIMNLPVILLPMLLKLFKEFKERKYASLCEKTGQFSFLFGGLYAIGILLSTEVST